jgi:hypothetical protein
MSTRRELPNLDRTPVIRVFETPTRPNYTNNSMSPEAVVKSGPFRSVITQYEQRGQAGSIQNDPNYNLQTQQLSKFERNDILIDPKTLRGSPQTLQYGSKESFQKLPKRTSEDYVQDTRNNQYVQLYGANVAEKYVRKNLNSRPEIVSNDAVDSRTIQQQSDAIMNLHMTNFSSRFNFQDAQAKSHVRIYKMDTVFPRGENTRL